jgi:hypothetical protein
MVLAIVAAVHPGRLPVALPVTVLGLSVVQLVYLFFNRPAQQLTALLNKEAVIRMLLESRSLRLALARYHLTTPEALSCGAGAGEQVSILKEQLNVLADLDRVDFDTFKTLDSLADQADTGAGARRRTAAHGSTPSSPARADTSSPR